MLYNDFRPQTFEEVRGQEVAVKIIRNQVLNNTANSFLLVGRHGTGKTTLAKIFARALNCENPQNGNPCNKCMSCKDYFNGNNYDIVEIDGASNNGVDDVRKIKDSLIYTPKKKKVYIIDEVHMLSDSAFNALLKTLEEPPKYVVFILCSTEVEKIPQTIRSRCLRIDLNRIYEKDIIEEIKKICTVKKYKYEIESLHMIANMANGSMRDALSILEKILSYDKNITFKNTSDVLGIVDTYTTINLIKNIIMKQTPEMLNKINQLYYSGKDLSQLILDMIQVFRNIMIFQVTQDLKLVKGLNFPEIEKFQLNSEECFKAINILTNICNQIKNSDNQKVLVDAGLMYLEKNLNGKILEENINKKLNKKTSLSSVNHNDYLIYKTDLIRSYDIKSEEVMILVKADIYTKHNAFVIRTPDANKLNIEDIRSRLFDICNKELNVEIKTA